MKPNVWLGLVLRSVILMSRLPWNSISLEGEVTSICKGARRVEENNTGSNVSLLLSPMNLSYNTTLSILPIPLHYYICFSFSGWMMLHRILVQTQSTFVFMAESYCIENIILQVHIWHVTYMWLIYPRFFTLLHAVAAVEELGGGREFCWGLPGIRKRWRFRF